MYILLKNVLQENKQMTERRKIERLQIFFRDPKLNICFSEHVTKKPCASMIGIESFLVLTWCIKRTSLWSSNRKIAKQTLHLLSGRLTVLLG